MSLTEHFAPRVLTSLSDQFANTNCPFSPSKCFHALPTAISLLLRPVMATNLLPNLPHKHCPDAKPHDEEAAESVEQVGLAFELGAIGVDDGNRDNADEAIEGVKLGEFKLVAVDHDDAKDYLDEHRGLSEGDIPPKTPGSQGLNLVGSE